MITEEDKEKLIYKSLEQASKEIEKILLQWLALDKVEWIMGDIDHILFSHTNADLQKLKYND